MSIVGPRVAVVGAGMAGLACAYRLQRAGLQAKVFEAEPTVGGRTRTHREGDFLFDLGAITLSPAYSETIALLKEAGGGHLLETINPVLAIARGGALHEIDLARPISSLASLRLLSARGAASLLNLLPTLARTWSRSDFESMAKLASVDDESCRSFALRKLGREAHDFLVDPLIRVNMFTDTETSSVVDLLWLLKIFAGTSIVQVRGGMGAMSQTLAAGLDVVCGVTVERVEHRTGGGVTLTLSDREGLDFDAVVIAVPATVAAAIAPADGSPQLAWLKSAEPVQAVTVQVGLSRPPASRAALIMLPSSEHPDVLGIALDHNKSPDRTPPGKGAATIHLRAGETDGTDQFQVERALRAVAPLLGDLHNQVEASHVQRWSYVDHKRTVGSYRRLVEAGFDAQLPPIFFAGEYISAGIEGAVRSGMRCAEMVRQTMSIGEQGAQENGLGGI